MRMYTAVHSVWYYILPPTFLVEISVHLATLRRLVQLVWVSPKARVTLKILKESSAYQRSQIIHLAIEFLWGDSDLMRERREQAWKVEQDMKLTGR